MDMNKFELMREFENRRNETARLLMRNKIAQELKSANSYRDTLALSHGGRVSHHHVYGHVTPSGMVCIYGC